MVHLACFALFFVFLSCGAAPTESDTNPTCSAEDLQLLGDNFGSDVVGQILACAAGGSLGKSTCPPGGLNEVVESYGEHLEPYSQQVANCGMSGTPAQDTQPDLA